MNPRVLVGPDANQRIIVAVYELERGQHAERVHPARSASVLRHDHVEAFGWRALGFQPRQPMHPQAITDPSGACEMQTQEPGDCGFMHRALLLQRGRKPLMCSQTSSGKRTGCITETERQRSGGRRRALAVDLIWAETAPGL